ncbi:MAG: hypothetical protein ABIG60_05935 [Patescibacteria group bacterium]
MVNNIINSADINWFIPTWDLLILILFVSISFIYGISLGNKKMAVSLMCIYASLAIIYSNSYLDMLIGKVDWQYSYLFRIFSFWGLFILLFILLLQSPLAEYLSGPVNSWKSKGRISQIILFSFLHIGLLTSISMSFLPEELIRNLLPVTRIIFYNLHSKFIWVTAPLITMLLIQKQTIRNIEKEDML